MAGASLFPLPVNAGGVLKVAGSGFDAAARGKPVTWANGAIVYYTDQGDLSPALPNAQADALVADAFSRWTSVATAALTATRGGALAEDVSGSNVSAGSLPLDVQPTATDKPIAIVYDADGSVTDVFFGAGAHSDCIQRSSFGLPDAYTADGHFAHALIVMNGSCAATSTDLPDFRYHFLRAIGRVLGLGWSQLNDNVRTQDPVPTVPQINGYPLMHAFEWTCSGGISNCLINPETLRVDDTAAISRLYPVNAQNIGLFAGKTIFADSTVRIRGRILFPGRAAFGMQGVNVIARYVGSNGTASAQFAATCVSGFLFRGNAGNQATGFIAPTGERYDSFGSDDPALLGFFDIAGITFPAGATTGTVEISVEPINSLFSSADAVGALPIIVAPAGNAAAVRIANLSLGSDVMQDMIMQGAPPALRDSYEPDPISAPRLIPFGGRWTANLFGYGDTDFISFPAKAGHTLGVKLVALDEAGAAVAGKARITAGVWPASANAASPPLANVAATNGASSAAAIFSFAADGIYKLGIMDQRGDGRPDFLYRAAALYAGAVSPKRLPAQTNTPLLITGFGFSPSSTVSIGGASATVVFASATELLAITPQLSSGAQTLMVTDAAGGLQSSFPAAVQFGPAAGDHLVIMSGGFSSTSVGAEADHELVVQTLDAANTPVAGLPLQFSITPSPSILLACGTQTCNVTTDSLGRASTGILVKAQGTQTVTATLGTVATQAIQFNGVSDPSEMVVAAPKASQVLTTSSASVTLRFRVLQAGAAQTGLSVRITSSGGVLSSSTAVTDANGDATVNFNFSGLTSVTTVTGCVSGTTSCATSSFVPVPSGNLLLQKVSGDAQIMTLGGALQPMAVRLSDATGVPLLGVPVTFTIIIFPRVFSEPCSSGFCDHGMNRPLSVSTVTAMTDLRGLATVTPLLPTGRGAITAIVTAVAAGTSVNLRLDALK